MAELTTATLLTFITSLVTAAGGWVTSTVTTIGSDPILLTTCIGIPMIGVGIGLFKRIRH